MAAGHTDRPIVCLVEAHARHHLQRRSRVHFGYEVRSYAKVKARPTTTNRRSAVAIAGKCGGTSTPAVTPSTNARAAYPIGAPPRWSTTELTGHIDPVERARPPDHHEAERSGDHNAGKTDKTELWERLSWLQT